MILSEPFMFTEQISAFELNDLIAQKHDFFLLDVRTLAEHAAYNIGGTLIPVDELPHHLSSLPQDKLIVIYCRSGYRSQVALELLKQQGFSQIKNLVGGVLAWSKEVIES